MYVPKKTHYSLKAKTIISISLGINDISVFHIIILLKKVEHPSNYSWRYNRDKNDYDYDNYIDPWAWIF